MFRLYRKASSGISAHIAHQIKRSVPQIGTSHLRSTIPADDLSPPTNPINIHESVSGLPVNYRKLSAVEKQDLIWKRISAAPYDAENCPVTEPTYVEKVVKLIRPNYEMVSLTHDADEMPYGRSKIIHVHGTAAKMELKISSAYTGLFTSGGIGVVRLSSQKRDTEDKEFKPALALKIFIDGQRSQNIVAMKSVEGQGMNYNFFQNVFSNVIPKMPLRLELFSRIALHPAIRRLPWGTKDRPESPLNLGLTEHASVEANGRTVEEPVVPWEILFTPNSELGWDPNDRTDYRKHISEIPPGSVLYKVGLRSKKGADEEVVGELVTRSEFVASFYEDQILFFRHASKRWMPSNANSQS